MLIHTMAKGSLKVLNDFGFKKHPNLSNVKTSRCTDADKLILKICSSEKSLLGLRYALVVKGLEDFKL